MKKLLFLSTAAVLIFASSFAEKKKLTKKTALKTLNGFCNYVPSGNAVISGDTLSVQSFYMSSTEITNFQYSEFLYSLKRSGDLDKLAIAEVDSMKWNTTFKHADMKPMAEFYLSHPAYKEYPVVNISKEAAELFCEWLSDSYDTLSGGELKLKFRLPTHAEWMRAARGDNHKSVYAWGGHFVRNPEGQFMGNFVANGSEYIRRNKETDELEYVHIEYKQSDFISDGAFITAPVKSFWPNDFGFYNMNGNVSELISDGNQSVGGGWRSPGYDVRNESTREFKGAAPTVGFRVVASYLATDK